MMVEVRIELDAKNFSVFKLLGWAHGNFLCAGSLCIMLTLK